MRTGWGIVLGLALAGPASGQSLGRDWSPRDRTVIGNFTRITAVAAASDRVYATSPNALLVWNPLFRRFEGPYQPPHPEALRRVFQALVDPLDNSLWLARVDGWVHYDPYAQRWDEGPMAGGVQEIAFDLDDPVAGLFLRTGGGWTVVARGSLVATPSRPPARPLRPLKVEDAISANPSLLANSAQILMTRTNAMARYTAAARSFDGLGWYVGTWGAGLLFLPDGAALPQRLTFGLPGDPVGTVYGAPGGVWAATDAGAGIPAGLVFVSSDLAEFRWVEGTPGFGLPFGAARQMVGRGSSLWVGTDKGLARVDPGSGDVELLDEGRGLPDSRVLAVATRRGLIAVGTARGIIQMSEERGLERPAPEYADPVYALAYTRSTDTLWVGTPVGLRAALPGQPGLVVLDELRTLAALAEPVLALRYAADTLVGLTPDRLIWRDPQLSSWWLGPTLTPLLGRLRSFAVDQDGVWIAGDRALGFVRYNTMPLRTYIAPLDLPAPATDLAIDDDYLWVGTEEGLVRFRLEAIRP